MKITGFILTMIIITMPLFADKVDSSAGEYGFQLLKVDIGADNVSKGSAVSAQAGDASIMWYNPAATNFSDRSNVHFTHNEWIFDTRIEHISLMVNKGKYSLGGGITYLNYGKIDRRNSQGNLIGEFNPTDIIGNINFSLRTLPNLYCGVNVKGLFEKIHIETSYGMAVDLGIIYRTMLNGLNLSAVVQNLGTTSKMAKEKIDLPIAYKFGVGYQLPFSFLNLHIATDVIKYVDDDNAKVNCGLQYVFQDKVFTRIGYKFNYDEENITAGLGFKINCYHFDYAYVPFQSDIGATHRFSLSYDF
ncbi:MAG: hypothetical protein DRH57_00905 [Candidatus Cloacimonadota bacterium]|nr:MAG: hypothetical protein DRH57_00905 [Candidatus Cloacimonadota bacterium]